VSLCHYRWLGGLEILIRFVNDFDGNSESLAGIDAGQKYSKLHNLGRCFQRAQGIHRKVIHKAP
jgi:hypothetical protein